jgi:hypothetical protein
MRTIAEQMFVVAVALAAISCSGRAGPGSVATKADGEEAVRLFHQRFSDMRFEDIYASTHEAFRASASKAEILGQMSNNRQQYGAFVSAEQIGLNCRLQDVELWYHSRYERANVTEVFRWHVRDATAGLVMYRAFAGFTEARPELLNKCP